MKTVDGVIAICGLKQNCRMKEIELIFKHKVFDIAIFNKNIFIKEFIYK